MLGFAVAEVVTEVGSGFNGRRRKPHRVLSDPAASVLIVEHRDRLARFGVEHFQAALASSGRRLVVLDPEETTSDLAGDITEVPDLHVRPAVWAACREEPRCTRGHG